MAVCKHAASVHNVPIHAANLDCAVCIWDRRIVDPFRQPELTLPAKDFEEKNFEPLRDAKRVTALYSEMSRAKAGAREAILQRNLMVGLVDSNLGIYSKFHELAVYQYGYDDRKTCRLACMCVLRLVACYFPTMPVSHTSFQV